MKYNFNFYNMSRNYSENKGEFVKLDMSDDTNKYDRNKVGFYFPIKSRIHNISDLNPKNPANLKLTVEGTYSITRPDQGAQFVSYFTKHPEFKQYDLVDGTAGLGGDMIYLNKLFGSVTACEYNPTHVKAIQVNCAEYEIPINVHLCDFTKDYKQFLGPNTVLWLDPPWGGPDEWRKNNLKLYFYGEFKTYVNSFIKKCFDECKIPYCILKCPLRTYLADFDLREFRINIVYIKRKCMWSTMNPIIFQLLIISKINY